MTTPIETPPSSPIHNQKPENPKKSEKPNNQENRETPKIPKPTLWQILISVLGALVGVQSSRVQQRDFEHGRPWWVYALVWLGLVVLLVAGLAFLTEWIIQSSKT